MVKFACDCCGRSYSVAEELRGRAFKMKCKLCGHLIVVKPPAAPVVPPYAPEVGSSPIAESKPYSEPTPQLFSVSDDSLLVSESTPKFSPISPDLPFAGRDAGLGDWLSRGSAEPFPGAHSGREAPIPPSVPAPAPPLTSPSILVPESISAAKESLPDTIGDTHPSSDSYLDYLFEERHGSSSEAAPTADSAPEVSDSAIIGAGDAPEDAPVSNLPSLHEKPAEPGPGDPFAGWISEKGGIEPVMGEESQGPVEPQEGPTEGEVTVPSAVPAQAQPALPPFTPPPSPVPTARKKGGLAKPLFFVVAVVAVAGLVWMLSLTGRLGGPLEYRPPLTAPAPVATPTETTTRPQLAAPQLAAPDPQYVASGDKNGVKPDEPSAGQLVTPAPVPAAPVPENQAASRPNSTKVAQLIASQRKVFDECTSQAVSRNPTLAQINKKAVLIVTVVPSGDVTTTQLDDPKLDEPQLNACLKRAAKRMAFPAFEGGPMLVDVPLTFAK